MTESQIQSKILKYLRSRGGFVIKLSDKWVSGLPDIMYINKGVIHFFEVKTPKGVLSKIQRYTINKMNESGVKAHVVRSLNEVKEVI